MKKERVDSEFYEILHFNPTISAEIQDKIDTAYSQIRNNAATPGRRKKHGGFYLGFAAAIILALGFLGFSNPVLAGKIPFVGRIFQIVESQSSYPGNYSENAIPITNPDNDTENSKNAMESDTGKENKADSAGNAEDGKSSGVKTDSYSQTVGDITITLSEAAYTEIALYFSLEIYSEEGFPEDFNRVKNMEDYILSYDFLNMQSSQIFDFSQADPDFYDTDVLSCTIEDGLPAPYAIEGNYVDSHTFLGIIRVDINEIQSILEVDTVPPEFIYSFTINKFWGELKETQDTLAKDPETGETFSIPTPVRKYYVGPWSFTVPVSLEQTDTQTKEIMETNADGIGISTVTKTRYEIKADIILPEGAQWFDYIVAITDADGKILDSQGDNADIYSVYGRNTDTIHIYVVDYFTFMDECKAENAYRLPEKALFQTTVEW